MAVLDIRNGKVARPEHYHRIYWDFVTDSQSKPRPDSSQRVSLQDLMTQAKFAEGEFAKLKEAEAKSNGLVNLEVRAMNALKGKFEDGAGGYTRTAEPDPALAQGLVHGKDYHQFKAQIMKPIDEFFTLMETRTQVEVTQASAALSRSYYQFMGLMIVIMKNGKKNSNFMALFMKSQKLTVQELNFTIWYSKNQMGKIYSLVHGLTVTRSRKRRSTLSNILI